MKIEGKLKVKNDTQVVSEKFSKREFVITTSGEYPQDILLQLTQDKCSLLDSINIGDTIEAGYNLKGREWKTPTGEVKYFNTIEVWKINTLNQSIKQPKENAPTPLQNENTDGLPF